MYPITKFYPVLLQQHRIEFDAMNDVVQLLLAASVDGFGDGAMQNVDGVVARVVHVGLGPQALKQVLDEVRAGR